MKKKPMGEIMPMAFCSMGKSLVDILDVGRRVKYWMRGDLWAEGAVDD